MEEKVIDKIEVEALVTINPETQTHFFRIGGKNGERIEANYALDNLESFFSELNNGNEIFELPDLKPGDKFKLTLEIERKNRTE
jgi:hypothetical protein